MKKDCKTCTVNSTNDTVETCKRPCYLRYSKQRKERICELENKLNKYKQALEEIRNNLKNICDRECDFHWCKGSCPDSDCDYYTNINKINEVLDA